MASLDSAKVSQLRSAIENCPEPFLLAFLAQKESNAKTMEGTLGIIDWCLHGSISRLLEKDSLDAFTLVPQNRLLGKASLLLLRPEGIKNLSKVLSQLKISRVAIAASTFPDIAKLEQSLNKANVHHTRLEQ